MPENFTATGTCPYCGLLLYDGRDMCAHHPYSYGDRWSDGNRIWCDFFHRGVVPPRLPEADRDDYYEE